MDAKNCKACDYFVDTGNPIGICQRYPQYQSRSPNERCGEFMPLSYQEPVPEMLALPVLDMEQPKRKGRPPKKAAEVSA